MFELNGYRVGLKQEDGSVEEFVTMWAETEREALLDAKKTALAVGDPVQDIVIRRITDKDEIIESMNEEILALFDEIDELKARLAEYEDDTFDEDGYFSDGVVYGGEDLSIPVAKTCTKCHEIKPLDQFYAQKDGKHGRRADCIECKKAAATVTV